MSGYHTGEPDGGDRAAGALPDEDSPTPSPVYRNALKDARELVTSLELQLRAPEHLPTALKMCDQLAGHLLTAIRDEEADRG